MRAVRTSSQLNQSARSSHSRSPASSVSSHSHPVAHPDGSSSADTPGWLTGTICTDTCDDPGHGNWAPRSGNPHTYSYAQNNDNHAVNLDGVCRDGGSNSVGEHFCAYGTDCTDCGVRTVADGVPVPTTCDDTCPGQAYRASNGYCDDGGPGAEYGYCELGTDCTDCGPRNLATDNFCEGDGECGTDVALDNCPGGLDLYQVPRFPALPDPLPPPLPAPLAP